MTIPFLKKVRASSLSTFDDCQRRWAARYMAKTIGDLGIDLRETPRSVGASVGTGTHAAAAELNRDKMDGRPKNAKAAEEKGVTAFEQAIEDGVMWDDTTPNLDTGQKQVIRMSRVYDRDVTEKIEPVLVETRLEAIRASGLMLSGTEDVMAVSPATLRDLKTGVKARGNAPQYGAYSMLLRTHGKPVTGIREDFVQRTSMRKEQPATEQITYPIDVAEKTSDSVLRRIERTAQQFADTMDPYTWAANPMSVLCADKWCPAWGTAWCRVHPGAK